MQILVTNFSFETVISGGDVIAAEYTKCFINLGHRVILGTHKSGSLFFRSRNIKSENIKIMHGSELDKCGILISSFAKTACAVIQTVFWNNINPDMIFSSSWMWPDLFPALVLKFRFPKAKLVVGCYLFLMHPKSKSYGKNNFDRYVFWVVYKIGLMLIKKYANMVWTASERDAKEFQMIFGVKTFAVRGGVDVKQTKLINGSGKLYDAIFIGRFHPQKNIIELLDIWKDVHNTLPNAKLLIAGDGYQKQDILTHIKNCNIVNTVTVMEMVDGVKKIKLLHQSKIFVLASHFDSGNLSLDESLACKTPGVCYDLPRLNYPKGVVKIPLFNKNLFVKAIVDLLQDNDKRRKLSTEAESFGQTLDWKKSAKYALTTIN